MYPVDASGCRAAIVTPEWLAFSHSSPDLTSAIFDTAMYTWPSNEVMAQLATATKSVLIVQRLQRTLRKYQ